MFESGPQSATIDKRPTRAAANYERRKIRANRHQLTQSVSGREIAPGFEPLTDRKLLAEKRRILTDLARFCKTIFPNVFFLPWSADHLRIISKLQRAIIDGGQNAIAMPRASGKSAISTAACLWALVAAYHDFVLLIAATAEAAGELLKGLRTQLQTNGQLAKYFPEISYPIQRLQRVTQRRLLWEGADIVLRMTDSEIVLPNLPPNPAASAMIAVAGLTGRIRGMKFTRPDGREARPSMVLLDDPQTDESAKSETQSDYRERLINGAVLGLAGPDRNMTAIAAVTVICAGDLSDRILSKERNPQWRAERTRLVNQWPNHPEAERLWSQYVELRKQCQREDLPLKLATDFYRQNRAKMDAGAIVPWPDRKGETAISALQHAYDLKADQGEVAFQCEYQNNPPEAEAARAKSLDTEQLLERLNKIPRGTIPVECNRLTGFIDIQHAVLFWLVAAWDDKFGGTIVDYGTWPKQNRLHFDLTNLTRTLQDELPAAGLEAQVFHGLRELTKQLLGREWPRDGGTAQALERLPIDANDGALTDLIYQFCRTSEYRAIVIPSHGHYAPNRSVGDWKPKPGDLSGPSWRSPAPSGKRAIRHTIYDTNFWKTHVYQRFAAPLGAPSAATINGNNREENRLLAEHLSAEYATEVTRNERTKDEWIIRPGRRNEWFDGIVGAAVAASMLGARLPENQPAAKRRPMKLTYLQR